ncbi:hypothetical protein BGZ65_005946, partial [Modicella reniformis]
MPPPKRYIQQIRFDNVVKKVQAKEKNGQIYVLFDAIKDMFEDARRLEDDGVGVPFLTDENDVRIIPLRVEYHEDCILDVIVGSDMPPPISIPSPRSTAPTTPSSSFTGSLASPPSLSPVSVAPLAIIRPSMTKALSPVPEVTSQVASSEAEMGISSQATTPDGHARIGSFASSYSTSFIAEQGSVPPAPGFSLDMRQEMPSQSPVDIDHPFQWSFDFQRLIPHSSFLNTNINYQAPLQSGSLFFTQSGEALPSYSPQQQEFQQQLHYQHPSQYQQPYNQQPYNQQFQQPYYQQYQQSYQQQYLPQHPQPYQLPPTINTAPIPFIPPRPGVATSPIIPVNSFARLSIGTPPQTLDLEGKVLSASYPTASSPSVPRRQSPPSQHDRTLNNSTLWPFESNESGLEFVPESQTLLMENETKVKELEMKLRRAQDQTLIYAKKNHALARESLQMSSKIMNRATQIQNKVQAVLTQNYELHENPVPRLFIVLPVLILDQSAPTKPMPSSDQRKFRVHFLCECGKHTRALQTSGLNHIHFVEHEGYEIEHPVEFFEKYGMFIRSLSHLIRTGVDCGTVSILPLLAMSQQKQQQQQQQRKDRDSIFRAYSVGQETLMNQILDTRLAEAIDYLDSLETLVSPDNDTSNETVEYFDGKNIRQLQAYIKIPPEDGQSLASLYKIITSRGHVKWICEEHYRSSVHHQNEFQFQQELSTIKGHYDLRIGRARIQLASAQDANLLYKLISKAHNLHELDVGLGWSFTESDLQKFVQTVQDSNIRALTLDGCKQKPDPSVKLMNFGKKYDQLLRIIFGSRIGSLKIINIPSMLLKISTKQPQPPSQAYGLKALHLENVGVLDYSTPDKSGVARSIGASLNIANSNTRVTSLFFLRNLVTSFQSLAEINLPGMNIRDEGVTLITEQINLQKTLRHINLYNNAISPVGGRLLAVFLSREKALVHLDLAMNPIGDEAAALVIDALGSNLLILSLEGTGFRDNAAKALERMIETYNSSSGLESRLEYLNLAGNGWTTSSIQSLGRVIMRMRLEIPPPSSPSITAPLPRKHDKPGHLEMGAAEGFMLINSMIRTTQLTLPTDKPWYRQPNILSQYVALTATKESYSLATIKAQDSIRVNSKFKVLRLSDAGLSEGAARYLIGLLDVNVLTKMDLRRCIRLFKPREVLTILGRVYPNSSYLQEGDSVQQSRQGLPQAPTPCGIVGSPHNCLRFLHLNLTGVDNHVARILAQDLGSSWCCLERLDIGSNHLTHQGVTLLLDALCQNNSLQHLNLGQNFSSPNTVYMSSASALAKATKEAFKRFMMTNKTLQILYFICADIDVVAQGLSANTTLRSLVFDRLEGSLNDVEALGRALVMNQTLMRLKVYDNRQAPFLEAFYGNNQQQQVARYVDPFKDFKQEAIKTIEKGITFNYTLIEVQWPEIFDRQQPCTERLEALLTRNMALLKNGTIGNGHDIASSQDSSNGGVKERGSLRTNRVSRGLSVLSTTSTLSYGTDISSSSSLSSIPSPIAYARDQAINRSQSMFVPAPSTGPSDGYPYSIHSNSSQVNHNGIGDVVGGGGNTGTFSTWDERRLTNLELSPWTLAMLKNTP